MSSASVTFSSTAIGFPDSSRIIESWDMARFSSCTDSRMAGMSDTPQNFFGSRRLGMMTKGMKP